MKVYKFNEIQLQELRIPAGWYIHLNKFYHIAPDPSIESQLPDANINV
jgi:hypothetical protein